MRFHKAIPRLSYQEKAIMLISIFISLTFAGIYYLALVGLLLKFLLIGGTFITLVAFFTIINYIPESGYQ